MLRLPMVALMALAAAVPVSLFVQGPWLQLAVATLYALGWLLLLGFWSIAATRESAVDTAPR
jgi:hypothetical protein